MLRRVGYRVIWMSYNAGPGTLDRIADRIGSMLGRWTLGVFFLGLLVGGNVGYILGVLQ